MSVPFIVQAWDGRDEVDLVPIDRLEPRPEGVVWMSGRGSRFTAEATWSPILSPVPRWDVAIELRFEGGQPVDASFVFAVRLGATSEPGWMIPGLFRGWGKGWASGENSLHGRTLAEAVLFTIRAVVAEERLGRPHGVWRDAIASNLAFVIDRQRSDGAFPSAWNGRTGKVVSWDGSAGAAWVPALVEGAALVGDAVFVESACRAGDFYADHVESEFLFGAPEDVDLGPTSEDGYVAVMAYMALAEVETRAVARSRWLELARRAADWMLTFRYSYNVAFAPTTLLGRYDYRSRGADQASPANQHLHGYGLICLPEMVRLSSRTGDPYYLERARENLAASASPSPARMGTSTQGAEWRQSATTRRTTAARGAASDRSRTRGVWACYWQRATRPRTFRHWQSQRMMSVSDWLERSRCLVHPRCRCVFEPQYELLRIGAEP